MDDAEGQVTWAVDLADNHGTMRWKSRSETLSNRTMYLWGFSSLCTEHLLLAQAIALTELIPRVKICGCLVDAVLVEAAPAEIEKLRELVDGSTRPDKSPFWRLKDRRDAPACKPMIRHIEAKSSAWGREADTVSGKMIFKPSNEPTRSSSLGNWMQKPRFL